jgi:hypothetical protein
MIVLLPGRSQPLAKPPITSKQAVVEFVNAFKVAME